MAKKKPKSAGEAFAELAKANPELLASWEANKEKLLYQAKGRLNNLRLRLQLEAARWREATGTEPPDLKSLADMEALASDVGVPFEQWDKLTAGEIFELGLEKYRVQGKALPDKSEQTPNQNKGAKATYNALMIDEMKRNHECYGWTCRRWARFLGCSASTVTNQPAWDGIKVACISAKLERAKPKDRRRGRR